MANQAQKTPKLNTNSGLEKLILLIHGYVREWLNKSTSNINTIPLELLDLITIFSHHETRIFAIGEQENGQFGMGNTNQINELTQLNWTQNVQIDSIKQGYGFAVFKSKLDQYFLSGDHMRRIIKPEQIKPNEFIIKHCEIGGCWGRSIFYITTNNILYGHGHNKDGELGLGHRTKQTYPIILFKDEPVKTAKTGFQHSLLLTCSGNVYSTGISGGNNQLGHNQHLSLNKWTKIKQFNNNIIHISLGSNSTVLLDDKHNVWTFGELSGSNINNPPQRVKYFVENNIKINKISVGHGDHLLCLDQNGNVYSWGQNGRGQCGNGTTTNSNPWSVCFAYDSKPYHIKILKNVQKIFTGFGTSGALTKDNQLYLWGLNDERQCINFEKDELLQPYNVNKNIFDKQYPGWIIIDCSLGLGNVMLLCMKQY
eukprot:113464_1